MSQPKIKTEIELRIKNSGDTMVGSLLLNENPTQDSHAVTKKYVDDKIDKTSYLSLSGGTLTGGLEIKNTGPMFTMTNTTSGQDMRLYPASNSVILLNRNIAGDSSNYRALYLHNSTASSSINSALVFQDTVNGTANNYNILHAGNYNNYAPTKGGTGASGTWGIDISGNSATTSLLKPTDNLDTTSYNKSNWMANVSANNGYVVWREAFCNSNLSADTGDIILWMNNSTTLNVTIDGNYYAYGSYLVLNSNNYTSYTVTKTGSGASGTWPISISGTATKATQDGSGNTITSTYLPVTNGTLKGNLNLAPSMNFKMTPTQNGSEWSFDFQSSSYTGCYWHVWDASKSSLLSVYQDDGRVQASYNFQVNGYYTQNGTAGGIASMTSSSPNTKMLWAY